MLNGVLSFIRIDLFLTKSESPCPYGTGIPAIYGVCALWAVPQYSIPPRRVKGQRDALIIPLYAIYGQLARCGCGPYGQRAANNHENCRHAQQKRDASGQLPVFFDVSFDIHCISSKTSLFLYRLCLFETEYEG